MRRLAIAFVLSTLVAAGGGCQSISSWDGAAKDVAPSRKARQTEVVGQFNQKRDMAEFQAATECYQRNDFSGCTATLKPLVKRNPDHVEGQLLLADALVARDRCKEAIAELQPLAERHPENAGLQHKLGRLWDNAGDTHRALDCYRRASEQEPDNEVYRLSFETAARQIAATVPVTSMLEMPATGATGPLSAGVQLAGYDGTAEPPASAAAGNASDRVASAASSEAGPPLSRALDTLRRGPADAALPMIEELIAANPHDPQIPISAAVAALQCNQPDVVIALVTPALRRFPQMAALYRILATAHYRRGDYAASQTALEQSLSLDKSSALSYFLMGCTLTKLGRTDAAAEHFRRARQIDPRFTVQQ